jgi:hypothetical protein
VHKKVPLIEGKLPDELYDLDKETDLQKLNLNSKSGLKIADNYAHYQHCKHAVIESKSNTLRNAIEQLESTMKQLLEAGRKVDLPIIVANRLNRWEKQIFKRSKENILLDRNTGAPHLIRVGSNSYSILLFYSGEVTTMHFGLHKYISR